MILCAGEALIDMLPRETTAGEAAFAPHAGGAVFNTAIALGRLRVPTGFFSGLSTDLFGAMLEESLAASNVDARFAARSDRPTTLAFVRLVDGHATYAFYDENTAGRLLTDADLPSTTGVDAMFFGGISLVVEPCATAYEALMLREAAERVTMIDPNIRPGFINDEDRYRARITRMMAAADIVKVSDEDLTWLRGPGDMNARAEEVRAMGPAIVLVTRGALGANAYHAGGHLFVESWSATVVDTVGAGDTFNAGFLASLHEQGALNKAALRTLSEGALTEAVTMGAKAAAITVSRAGANPPARNEL
ncbi:MAG: carbohydrate kinase [Pseudomonadota bacterium]